MIKEAIHFATNAHEGQTRKYDGSPYISHPIRVMQRIEDIGGPIEMRVAAVLHDTVEDTDVTIKDIHLRFGWEVAIMVRGLTDTATPADGNRAVRAKMSRDRIAKDSYPVKTVKLADILDNAPSIIEHDPKFAKVWMGEKMLMVDALKDGHNLLYNSYLDLINSYFGTKHGR